MARYPGLLDSLTIKFGGTRYVHLFWLVSDVQRRVGEGCKFDIKLIMKLMDRYLVGTGDYMWLAAKLCVSALIVNKSEIDQDIEIYEICICIKFGACQ